MPPSVKPGHKNSFLYLAIAIEVAIFALVAPNFFTLANFFEIARLNAELGLLAVALTPILIAGGIDLSVGAVMGLAAVCFGAAWRDLHLPIPVAVIVALAVGVLGGGLNAVLISRLKLPALIVTLGTFSLFRGVAEGITEAAVNYSGFPPPFLALGQGYIGGVIPAQLPIFLLVLTAYAVLLHRSVIGRALYAIGFSPSGARFAGIPVENRIGLVYLLSGIVSSVCGCHLCRPSGPGALGCGKRIRARRHYRSGTRRNVGVRRARNSRRNGAGAHRAFSVEKRIAGCRAADRVDWDSDRRSTRVFYESRGPPAPLHAAR
jgi:ribose/xylose/arabinose/galactoside ABC-type transport system permease subunit